MRLRERLVPPWWLFVACLLVVPASILVFLPIAPWWGVAVAVVLFGAACAALVALSPVIEVGEGTLRAGRARIPLDDLGTVEALDVEASSAALHTGFDASAYLCTVAWVRTLVRAPVVDQSDPTTAWLVSTRRPDALVAAIEAERRSPTAQR